LTPDDATGFDMTFELGLLECCRQHKVWVADILRNCTIAIPLLPTNSPNPAQKNRICESMKIYQNE
jgi:hypothetical protein